MEDATRAVECLCASIPEAQRPADETWAAALTKALYLQACGPHRIAVANSHTRTRRDSCACKLTPHTRMPPPSAGRVAE